MTLIVMIGLDQICENHHHLNISAFEFVFHPPFSAFHWLNTASRQLFSFMSSTSFYLYCNILTDCAVKCQKPRQHEIETYYKIPADHTCHCGYFPDIPIFYPRFQRRFL